MILQGQENGLLGGGRGTVARDLTVRFTPDTRGAAGGLRPVTLPDR